MEARNSEPSPEPREHGRDPPPLQAAVNDQPGQEEAHEERRLQVEGALVVRGGLGEAEEEQEGRR